MLKNYRFFMDFFYGAYADVRGQLVISVIRHVMWMHGSVQLPASITTSFNSFSKTTLSVVEFHFHGYVPLPVSLSVQV